MYINDTMWVYNLKATVTKEIQPAARNSKLYHWSDHSCLIFKIEGEYNLNMKTR